jgi:hypothetical protein
VHLRTGNADPDVPMLLRLINEHYRTIERERRGIVESMRLMADEAQALRSRRAAVERAPAGDSRPHQGRRAAGGWGRPHPDALNPTGVRVFWLRG